MALLTAFDWPGNVRQLQNVIARSAVVCNTEWIALRDLPDPEHLRVGAQTALQGITYTVAFNQPVSLAATGIRAKRNCRLCLG